MKSSTKIFLGVFTALATIAFIVIYDHFIKDRIDSEQVVVVKAGESIGKSEEITRDKLVIERRQRQALINDVVLAEDIKKIIGLDTKQELVGNSMISAKMIDFEGMEPNEKKGEAIRPITKDMIYAQPGSLRRKDVIDIYLISKQAIEAKENGPTSTSEKNISPDNSLKPFLQDVKVVYVKDSGNKEVVTATDEKVLSDKDERLNGTSQISDLEVILDNEDFSKLMKEVVDGQSQLYITYK